MKEDLKVALVQQNIVWENPDQNKQRLTTMLSAEISADVDLIVLPEMFLSGFTMSPQKVAIGVDSHYLDWLSELAVSFQVFIMGSLVIEENGGYYNRMVIMGPNGERLQYNKRHLFRIGGEQEHYKAGTQRMIFEVKGWRILPLICYDLRFPVWSRNRNDYDLMVYVANWPASRKNVWEVLLQARAIENQSCLIGVNRVGKDHANNYSGNSVVLDAKGQTLLDFEENKEGIKQIVLNKADLLAFREKFPAWQDADDFTLA